MSKRGPTALFHSSVCHGSVVTPINRVRATDVGAPGDAGATVSPTVRTLTRACRSNRDLDGLAFEPGGGTPMGRTPTSVMTSGMPVLVEHRREGDDAGRRHEERHLEDEDRK